MKNPFYKLPEGNVLITLSGGQTSAFLLRQIIDSNDGIPERARIIFTPTGLELNSAEVDFVNEISERWGVNVDMVEYRCEFTGAPHDPSRKIFDSAAHSYKVVDHSTVSRDGRPFLEIIKYFGYLPNRSADFCSHELKTRTSKRYCLNELGWENWTTSLGIRYDEKNRALKKQPKERYKVWYPLIDDKITKSDIQNFWAKQDFGLKLQSYGGVTPLGNCDGCFKKSEAKRAVLARQFPERAKWWADLELKHNGNFRRDSPWVDLIDYVERQGDWIFDEEDALCQADSGECIG